MEYKINRMRVRNTQLFFDIILRIFQNNWHQLHVSWFVNTMNVSKRSCNGEVRRNFTQFLICVKNMGWLSIEKTIIQSTVINTIFFTTGDSKFDFERHSYFAHPFEVTLADCNIFFDGL